jgi:hypothetical protein
MCFKTSTSECYLKVNVVNTVFYVSRCLGDKSRLKALAYTLATVAIAIYFPFRIHQSCVFAGSWPTDYEKWRSIWPQSHCCRMGNDRKQYVWFFVTNSMKMSPCWEADSNLAGQEIVFYASWTFITVFTRTHHWPYFQPNESSSFSLH